MYLIGWLSIEPVSGSMSANLMTLSGQTRLTMHRTRLSVHLHVSNGLVQDKRNRATITAAVLLGDKRMAMDL